MILIQVPRLQGWAYSCVTVEGSFTQAKSNLDLLIDEHSTASRGSKRNEEILLKYVGFELLTVVPMKIDIFWDIAPCSPYI
jgi:hypothetical protein